FMVNCVAPYLLTESLLPQMKQHTPARIVLVNSGLYTRGLSDPATTPSGKNFSPLKAYAASKQASVFHMIEWAKQLEGSGITVNAVHPGVIQTGLGDAPHLLGRVVKWMKRLMRKPAYGALAPCRVALDPALEGVNGHYFYEQKDVDLSEKVLEPARQAAWQQWTQDFLQKPIEVKPPSS
ncbi:MAG: SDR family NAD(P)-dependent oxidoreductase, partial [Bacteroidota bacterium]